MGLKGPISQRAESSTQLPRICEEMGNRETKTQRAKEIFENKETKQQNATQPHGFLVNENQKQNKKYF